MTVGGVCAGGHSGACSDSRRGLILADMPLRDSALCGDSGGWGWAPAGASCSACWPPRRPEVAAGAAPGLQSGCVGGAGGHARLQARTGGLCGAPAAAVLALGSFRGSCGFLWETGLGAAPPRLCDCSPEPALPVSCSLCASPHAVPGALRTAPLTPLPFPGKRNSASCGLPSWR